MYLGLPACLQIFDIDRVSTHVHCQWRRNVARSHHRLMTVNGLLYQPLHGSCRQLFMTAWVMQFNSIATLLGRTAQIDLSLSLGWHLTVSQMRVKAACGLNPSRSQLRLSACLSMTSRARHSQQVVSKRTSSTDVSSATPQGISASNYQYAHRASLDACTHLFMCQPCSCGFFARITLSKKVQSSMLVWMTTQSLPRCLKLQNAGVRKKACRPSAVNPFIQAALAEARHTCTDMSGDHDGDGGSYSDLEDFIVCKPDRSYTSLFAQHYKYSAQEQGC